MKCAACGGPRSGISREIDRTRKNALCPECFNIEGTCFCGCGKTFPLYNGHGDTRRYFRGSHIYNNPETRQIFSKERSKMMKRLWQSSEYRKKKVGANHPNWKGGIWWYPPEFNKKLKKKVREKYGDICPNPKCPNRNKEVVMNVHHIDGDKYNNEIENLTVLCVNCHKKLHPHQGKKPLIPDWLPLPQ